MQLNVIILENHQSDHGVKVLTGVSPNSFPFPLAQQSSSASTRKETTMPSSRVKKEPCNTGHVTLDTRHVTRDTRHVTRDT